MNEELITLTLQEEDSLSLTTDEYIKGDKGDAATVSVGKTTTGEPGTDASVVNSGDEHAAILDFTIPRGEIGRTATVAVGNVSQGAEKTLPIITNTGTANDAVFDFTIPKGDTGKRSTIAVGTVTTGSPDSAVVITNIGTDTDAIFDISIPKGTKGDKGDTGEDFHITKTYPSIAEMEADIDNIEEGDFVIIASNVEDEDNSKLFVKTDSAFKLLTDLSGAQGFKGDPGKAATITVGGTTTIEPSSSAAVINTGDENAAVLQFSIPKGDKGDGATIKVGTVTTVQDGVAHVTNSGDELNAVFDFDIPQGTAATIKVGTVTTGAEGTEAIVTNSGTTGDAVFNFTIPKGDTGKPLQILGVYDTLAELKAAHPTGNVGDAYMAAGALYMWLASSTDWKYCGELRGPTGETGQNATIKIGTVVTGDTSSVTNSGTETDAVLDFVLQKGDKGDPLTYEDLTKEQVNEIIDGIIARADYATKSYVVARRTVTTGTILADTQYWSEGVYKQLETTYPTKNYDIEVALARTASDTQKSAWFNAAFMGDSASNWLYATGTVPTADIPVLITIYDKRTVEEATE